MEKIKTHLSSRPDPSGSQGSEEQAFETATEVSNNDKQAIPNGGSKAWLQVLGAFFIFFNTW
jgi:hypothetical protein